MHQERGNFLLQALLALALIFAFVPFMAQRLSGRNSDTRMYAATRQVETAQTAARIFIRENANNIPYETTIVSGDDFSDLLEPYGLPLGFVPRTALGQDIALVITKTPMAVSAYLELSGGNLSGIELAEMARRIGFYANQSGNIIQVGIDLANVFSDVVRRNETDLDNSGFLTDLNMGGFSVQNIGNMFSVRGNFDSAQCNTLSIAGVESGKKAKNDIKNITASKTVFQDKSGAAALSLTKGTLYVDTLDAKTISKYGDTGNFTTNDASVYELSMTAGRTSFVGPSEWNVRGSVVSDHMNFSVERLDVSGALSATRGQDVFIDVDTLEYSTKSGLEVDTIYTSNITLRDQTSSALNTGASGAVVLDIRPAGTTLLPDAYVSNINNDSFAIISNPTADDDDTVDCKSIISDFEGVYNKQSLSQYLICQYVYWQRLEKRIDIKQCLMAGGNDCM